MSAESERVATFGRLEDGLREAGDWYHWGPYLSERHGARCARTTAPAAPRGNTFPHDHARSRAYRWGEDGLAGFCDVEQRLCLALAALERPRPDPQGADLRAHRQRGQPRRGRQGVLVVPRRAAEPRLGPLALPLSAAGVPLRRPRRGERPARQARARVRAARHRRLRRRPLLDRRGRPRQGRPGRPAHVACASPTPARTTDTLHVLPTAWFRNTWSWDRSRREARAARAPARRSPSTTRSSARSSCCRPPDDAQPPLLFCDNETNTARLFGAADSPPYPKDGINDHVVDGAATVDPAQRGHQGRVLVSR